MSTIFERIYWLRRYTAGGQTVAEVRYAYDGADREVVQQHLHQGGRANFYAYDTDSRLTQADLFARLASNASAPGWALRATAWSQWRSGDYSRSYTYGSPDDRLTGTTLDAYPQAAVPYVAQTIGNASAMGHPEETDGRGRTFDGFGNVTSAYGVAGAVTMAYDGQSRLRRVETSSATIDYVYRADGALATREIVCKQSPGCEASQRSYVYDGLLLMEVHETRTGTTWVSARYFYADEGDIPLAADFDEDGPLSGPGPQRHYFVTDRMGSVIGVLNDSGAWVERINYDPWGQRVIQPSDTDAPQIAEIRSDGGDVYVIFTEAIQPRVDIQTASPDHTTPSAALIEDVLQNINGSGELTGVVEVRESNGTVVAAVAEHIDLAGYPVGSVVRLRSSSLQTNTDYDVVFTAGTLVDDWNNGIAASTTRIRFQAGSSSLHTGAAVGSTRPLEVTQSLVGNEVGFQAHLHDTDAGLILMRARAFDPSTGQFLQPDPVGHADSVNLYAGMAWDPVNLRDPTGEQARPSRRGPRGPRRAVSRGEWMRQRLMRAELDSIRKELPPELHPTAFPPRLTPNRFDSTAVLRSRLEWARYVQWMNSLSRLTPEERDVFRNSPLLQMAIGPAQLRRSNRRGDQSSMARSAEEQVAANTRVELNPRLGGETIPSGNATHSILDLRMTGPNGSLAIRRSLMEVKASDVPGATFGSLSRRSRRQIRDAVDFVRMMRESGEAYRGVRVEVFTNIAPPTRGEFLRYVEEGILVFRPLQSE